MNPSEFSRRRFLQAGVAASALGVMPGVQVIRDASAAGPGTTLVTIRLNGGNDSINTLVPYADPLYYSVRGSIALDRTQVLPLDERHALHPSMAGVKALWDQRKVAIVHGVGYPSFNYSHFEALEIYWTADPKRASFTGWLGRAMDLAVGTTTPDPLAAMSIGWSGSPSLSARNVTPLQLPPVPEWYQVPSRNTAQQTALFRVLQQPASTTNLLYDAFLRNSKLAVDAFNAVKAASSITTPVVYAESYIAKELKFAAQLMRADDAVRVIAIEQGSYDTHENQLPQQAESLDELSVALKQFMDDLQANGLSNRVLVLLWSEFARRVRPNAQNGTDHGSAQAMFLIGSGVRPGIVGTPASLASADLVEGGNLPMQVDFRQLYGTVLDHWLGIDSKAVLGAAYAPVPVLL